MHKPLEVDIGARNFQKQQETYTNEKPIPFSKDFFPEPVLSKS